LAKKPPIQVFVDISGLPLILIDVHLYFTVYDVKAVSRNKTGIPIADQDTLLSEGKPLHDNRDLILKDYGVREQVTLVLSVKNSGLKGGSPESICDGQGEGNTTMEEESGSSHDKRGLEERPDHSRRRTRQ